MSRLSDIRDWAEGYEGYDGLVELNALVAAEGAGGISATGSETVQASYIDGTEERQVEVQLRVAVPWSGGHDTLNPDAAELVEGWSDWVAAQWPDNPPEMDGAEVTGVEPVYLMPQLEGIDERARVAVYAMAIAVTFRTS